MSSMAKAAVSVLGEPGDPVEVVGGGGQEQAAELAYKLIPLTLQVLEQVLRKPTRQSKAQCSAAKLILDAAHGYKPQPVAPVTPIRLVDAQAAAEELRRRMQGK